MWTVVFLDRVAVKPRKWLPTFLRNVGNTSKTTRHHNPEDHSPHFHRTENLKSHTTRLMSFSKDFEVLSISVKGAVPDNIYKVAFS
jgi:hypothetical protein